MSKDWPQTVIIDSEARSVLSGAAYTVNVKTLTTDALLALKEKVDAELKFRMVGADKKLDGADAP